jgi:predicted O-linked N-acetylglucosamine transferase (SPINDLY family)
MIRGDRIDILVDLSGHTTMNRLSLFARRAAPVQVTYLGYANTTAVAAMDYRIVDDITDPPGAADALHTEKLLRIANGFLCYDPPPLDLPLSPAPATISGKVTFGSSNNLAKIDAAAISAWARLLSAVPDSRLLIKDRRLAIQDTRNRLIAAFARLGVDAGRIVTEEFASGPHGQFDFYQRVDIALDSFPYNGTTTTFETLWMGVPVIALAGDCHAGRVGMDILCRLGCPELIGADAQDYIAKAAALARDIPRIAALRGRLRGRLLASPLCDEARLAREIEAAYRSVWREWCATGA